MASIQRKGDRWYCQFIDRRWRYTFTIGKGDEIEAHAIKGKVEYLLLRAAPKAPPPTAGTSPTRAAPSR